MVADGLWTVPPWTTLRLAHTVHSSDDGDGVGTFSTVKWVLFQLSRFRLNGSSGSFFDRQMGTFSLDKNKLMNVYKFKFIFLTGYQCLYTLLTPWTFIPSILTHNAYTKLLMHWMPAT